MPVTRVRYESVEIKHIFLYLPENNLQHLGSVSSDDFFHVVVFTVFAGHGCLTQHKLVEVHIVTSYVVH